MKDWKKLYSKELRDIKYGGYSQKALDHFLNPRNVGVIEDADVTAIVGDPSCGDFLEMSIKVDPETETLEDVRFRVFGCGSAIATASALTEMVKGKKLKDALEVGGADVIIYLGGIPLDKQHCSTIAVKALRAAIERYLERKASEGSNEAGKREGLSR